MKLGCGCWEMISCVEIKADDIQVDVGFMKVWIVWDVGIGIGLGLWR